MEFEYEHINDIDKFIGNLKNSGASQLNWMSNLWSAVNEDLNYSAEDKERLLDAISQKWEQLEQEKNEHEKDNDNNSSKSNDEKVLDILESVPENKISSSVSRLDVSDILSGEKTATDVMEAKVLEDILNSVPKNDMSSNVSRQDVSDILSGEKKATDVLEEKKAEEGERIRKEIEEAELKRAIEEAKQRAIEDEEKRKAEEEEKRREEEVALLAEKERKDRRKSLFLKISALLAAGVTAISVGIGTILKRINRNKVVELPSAVSDNMISNESDKQNVENADNNLNVSTTKESEKQTDANKEVKNTTEKNNFKDRYKVSEEVSNEVKEQQENEITEDKSEDFQLGSVMKLPKELEFTETVFGGKVGKVGDPMTPEDGIYVINRYAEISENEVSNRYGLNGKIEKHNKDSDIYVHIAYVPGAKTEEEAKKILENSNEKNEYDRGWIKMDKLSKVLEQQKQQENQQER